MKNSWGEKQDFQKNINHKTVFNNDNNEKSFLSCISAC